LLQETRNLIGQVVKVIKVLYRARCFDG
jgi:hypothetical protein